MATLTVTETTDFRGQSLVNIDRIAINVSDDIFQYALLTFSAGQFGPGLISFQSTIELLSGLTRIADIRIDMGDANSFSTRDFSYIDFSDAGGGINFVNSTTGQVIRSPNIGSSYSLDVSDSFSSRYYAGDAGAGFFIDNNFSTNGNVDFNGSVFSGSTRGSVFSINTSGTFDFRGAQLTSITKLNYISGSESAKVLLDADQISESGIGGILFGIANRIEDSLVLFGNNLDLSNLFTRDWYSARPDFYNRNEDVVVVNVDAPGTVVGSIVRDTINGSAGTDIIAGWLGNDFLNGAEGNDELYGGMGDDTLWGGLGADVLSGGDGDDTYYIDNNSDTIIEVAAGGTGDRVISSITHMLGDNLEDLLLWGDGAIQGFGNAADNTLVGNSNSNTLAGGDGDDYLNGSLGNDQLYGGFGADILWGGQGVDAMFGGQNNDIYYVTDAGDTVVETASGGHDKVFASVNYNLDANVEELLMFGSGNNSSFGGVGDHRMTGNVGNNWIHGGAGEDFISGYIGDDIINGGLDTDYLIGGAGRDKFVFDTTPGGGNIDRVSDFNRTDDTIVLDSSTFVGLTTGRLAALNFRRGTEALDGNDYIIYDRPTGALFYDADGNGAVAAVQFATLLGAPLLGSVDFDVV